MSFGADSCCLPFFSQASLCILCIAHWLPFISWMKKAFICRSYSRPLCALRWIQATHKGVDILVNNAGILRRGVGVFETFGIGPARETLATNYFGSRSVTEALLPCLRPSAAGARIVNVSSGLGHLHILGTQLQVGPLSQWQA